MAVAVQRDDHVPVAAALFVIVSGPPASGKSPLAPALAQPAADREGHDQGRVDGRCGWHVARLVTPAPLGTPESAYAGRMIVGEATTTVAVAPSEVFEFVLDLERYRQADRKIGRVGPVRRSGNTGTTTFSGRIRGLPGPSGTYPFTLMESRLQFGSPIGGLARWFLDFEGSFDCEVLAAGTVVTHREVFKFKRPWRWVAEPLLRRWLETDTAEEMIRFKALVERCPDGPTATRP